MDLTGLSVLVIDDDPYICEICEWLLQSEGYGVQVAGDGASGLARMYGDTVDLVLLDLMLPDMDGLELCRQVRSRPSAVYLPIIMVTALADPARARQVSPRVRTTTFTSPSTSTSCGRASGYGHRPVNA